MGIFNEQSFGQQQFGGRGAQGAPGVGFNLTADGNYDMITKRLTNVGAPVSNADSATKKYVDDSKVDGSSFLKLDGSRVMTGNLDMNNNRVYNVPNPTGSQQPVTLTFGDQTYLRVNGTNSMTEPLNMNNKKIINLQTPIINTDAATKKYVDDKINTPHVDLSPFLKKDGSIPLSGNLNLNQNKILNLQAPTANNDAATKKYVDDKTRHPQNDPSSFLKKDGSIAMTGNLNTGGNKLINLQTPSSDTDATNRKYVDDLVAQTHVQPSHYKNEFAYLMGDQNQWTDEIGDRTSFILTAFADLLPKQGNFHSFNHKVLYIDILKNFQGGYKYKFGLNFFRLANGADYTLCLEILNGDYLLWHKSQISIDNTSSQGLQLEKTRVKKLQHRYIDSRGQTQFMYYHRLIINFRKLANQSRFFLHILVNIPQVGKDLAVYPLQYDKVFLIAYGIMSSVSDIDPDKVYDYHTGFNVTSTQVVLNLDVDANNKKILNIAADLTKDNSAATVGMVKEKNAALDAKINELIPFSSKYAYRKYFEDFYDFTDARYYKLSQSSSGVVFTGMGNKLTFPNKSIDNVIPEKGLKITRYNIQFQNTYPAGRNKSFTICIVLYHDKDSAFQLGRGIHGSSVNLGISYNSTTKHIQLLGRNKFTLPDSFDDKRIVIWWSFDGNTSYSKISISNFASTITELTHWAKSPRDVNSFSFFALDQVINKFMVSQYFHDLDSEAFKRVMLEEKLNGSYVL